MIFFIDLLLFSLVEYRTPSWKPVPTISWKPPNYKPENSSWEKGTYKLFPKLHQISPSNNFKVTMNLNHARGLVF